MWLLGTMILKYNHEGVSMAIEITKPQPMKVGDKYVYTLSSYEPIEATIRVPLVDDEEVRLACEALFAQTDQTFETVTDEWLAQNMPGMTGKEQLLQDIRATLDKLNEEFLQEQKSMACMAQMIDRLEQEVSSEQINEMYQALYQDYLAQLASEGMSEAELLKALDGGQNLIEQTIMNEAKDICAYDAALDAYVSHAELTLEDGDMAQLLQQPQEQIDKMIEAAREAGMYEKVYANALRAKALFNIMNEMSVVYEYETPEEAQARRSGTPEFNM